MNKKTFLFKSLLLLAIIFSVISFSNTTHIFAAGEPATSETKKTLYLGENGNTYTVTFKNKNDHATVQFSSSDKTIATVNKSGVVVAKSKGKTTITATITQNGKKYSSKIAVTVKNPYINITNKTDTIFVKQTYTFSVKAYGLSGSNFTWWTSDKSVGTINQSGVFTAKSSGTVKVTVKDTVNNKYSSVTIKIDDAPNLEFFISSKTKSNTSIFLPSITNNSTETITIKSVNCYLFDHEYDSYNRELTLIDFADAQNGIFTEISSFEIAPGEEAYAVLQSMTDTWYDSKSSVTLTIRYKGNDYIYSISSYYGSHLLDVSK